MAPAIAWMTSSTLADVGAPCGVARQQSSTGKGPTRVQVAQRVSKRICVHAGTWGGAEAQSRVKVATPMLWPPKAGRSDVQQQAVCGSTAAPRKQPQRPRLTAYTQHIVAHSGIERLGCDAKTRGHAAVLPIKPGHPARPLYQHTASASSTTPQCGCSTKKATPLFPRSQRVCCRKCR